MVGQLCSMYVALPLGMLGMVPHDPTVMVCIGEFIHTPTVLSKWLGRGNQTAHVKGKPLGD